MTRPGGYPVSVRGRVNATHREKRGTAANGCNVRICVELRLELQRFLRAPRAGAAVLGFR
jgi:hypothetical protein